MRNRWQIWPPGGALCIERVTNHTPWMEHRVGRELLFCYYFLSGVASQQRHDCHQSWTPVGLPTCPLFVCYFDHSSQLLLLFYERTCVSVNIDISSNDKLLIKVKCGPSLSILLSLSYLHICHKDTAKVIVYGRDSLGALIRTRQFDFFPSFNRHIRIEEGENSLKNIWSHWDRKSLQKHE